MGWLMDLQPDVDSRPTWGQPPKRVLALKTDDLVVDLRVLFLVRLLSSLDGSPFLVWSLALDDVDVGVLVDLDFLL